MALATQCPHCKTTFRVAQDQLKLRAGLVRCGSCKEIFNGIEHLLPSTTASTTASTPESSKPVAPPIPASTPVSSSAASAEIVENTVPLKEETDSTLHAPVPAPPTTSSDLDFIYPEPEPEEEELLESGPIDVEFVEVPRKMTSDNAEAMLADTEPEHQDPLQRMTLIDVSSELPADEAQYEGVNETRVDAGDTEQEDFTEEDGEDEGESEAEESDPLEEAIDELKRKPLRRKKKSKSDTRKPSAKKTTEDEPEFVKQGRRKRKFGKLITITMAVTSILLLLGVLGQTTYLLRAQIAARLPETKSALITACSFLRCNVGLPQQIEYVSIESNDLETLSTNKNTSELTVLIRNDSNIVQTWPNLDLTLNDTNGVTLTRRIFTPREYLPASQDMKKGLQGNSEQQVKMYFDFSNIKPVGYHVDLFYP